MLPKINECHIVVNNIIESLTRCLREFDLFDRKKMLIAGNEFII